MTTMRPHRHLRNRQPRPQLIESPPAPVTIIRAAALNSAHNLVIIELSANVAGATGVCTGFEDATDASHSATIHSGFPRPYSVSMIMNTNANRVGHTIRWTTPPPELQALGIPLAPESSCVIQVLV
jgi:hypothetical protein